MRGPSLVAGISLVVVATFTGCTTTKQSNTARTAAEQLLISNAVDQSLDKVSFDGLNGKKVLVEEKYLDCVDKAYILGSVRDRVARGGGDLVAKAEDADVILEVRSGGVGTDMSTTFAGIPAFTVPPLIALPQIQFASRDRQKGIAKIGLVAYDAKTMKMLAGGGVTTSLSDDTNWYVFGIGPHQSGSLRREMDRSIPLQPDQTAHSIPTEIAFTPPAGKTSLSSDLQHASGEDK